MTCLLSDKLKKWQSDKITNLLRFKADIMKNWQVDKIVGEQNDMFTQLQIEKMTKWQFDWSIEQHVLDTNAGRKLS